MSATLSPLDRLTAACASGNIDMISTMLDASVNINDKADKELRPIHSAAMATLEAVELLVSNGAEINAADADGNTPLHYASRSAEGDQIIAFLVERGAGINEKNKAKKTPLVMAIEAGNAAAVQACILAGANTDNAILEAIRSGGFHVGVVATLIEHAGGPELLDSVDAKSKEPALHSLAAAWATDSSDEPKEGYVYGVDAVSFWLDNGADLEIQNKNKENVIHCLATKDGSQLQSAMQFFGERGANMESKNKKNQTPLLAAASKCRAEAVSALVAAGVNLNAKDQKKQTALIHLAKSKKRSSIPAMEALLEAGADTSIAPMDDMTPLQITSKDGNAEKTRLLLAHGADPNLMHGSQHAIHLAAKKKKTEVITMLVEAGADLNEKDDTGKTPLFYAADTNNKDAVKALLRAGANINIRCNGQVALDVASGECERLIRARIR